MSGRFFFMFPQCTCFPSSGKMIQGGAVSWSRVTSTECCCILLSSDTQFLHLFTGCGFSPKLLLLTLCGICFWALSPYIEFQRCAVRYVYPHIWIRCAPYMEFQMRSWGALLKKMWIKCAWIMEFYINCTICQYIQGGERSLPNIQYSVASVEVIAVLVCWAAG